MQIRHRIQGAVTEFVAALVAAALIVVVPSALHAQQSSPAAKSAVVAEEEESAPTAQKPGGEGIKVHGHWVIDVKDKDGKIVEHRDFHNSLVGGQGDNILASLLSGVIVPDSLFVQLTGSLNGGSFYITIPGTVAASSICATGGLCSNTQNLTLTRTIDPNTGIVSLILSGQVTPASANSIIRVSTQLNACGRTDATTTSTVAIGESPSACRANNLASGTYGMGSSNFTSTTITPLSVAAGQSIAVTVTLSFS